jgi:hypothetical protein
MTALSSVDAALFAFKKRERRFVLTRAVLTYLAARVLVMAAMVALAWPLLQPVITWYFDAIRSVINGGAMSPPPLPALYALAPIVLASGLLSMILVAALEAACLRWMLRGEQGGPLVLNLGADTWRVFALYWTWFFAGLLFLIAVVAFYVVLRLLGGLHQALGVVTLLLGALAPLALAALAIWFSVRLAPAAALSIANQRFTFFGAWAATRGIFWPLLGGFVIVFVGYLVVAMIAGALLRLPFATALEPVWRDLVLNGGDPSALVAALQTTFTQPIYIAFGALYVAVTVTLACIFYVALYGVNARAVQVFMEPATSPAST